MSGRARRWILAASLGAAAGIVLIALFLDHGPRATPPLGAEPGAAAAPAASQPTTRPPGLRTPSPPVPFDPVRAGEAENSRPESAFDAASIAGIVLNVDETPAQDTLVALFRMMNGVPAPKSIAAEWTDAAGHFRFTRQPPAAGDCVLGAYQSNRRPATLQLSTVPAESRRSLRLTLGEGATISGVVHLDEDPVPGASVSADSKWGVPGWWFDGMTELWWETGAFELKHASASCDRNGRFSLTGLQRGTYRVDATDLARNDRSMLGDVSAKVTAPASGVDLGVETGSMRIRVLGNGEVIPGAQIAITEPQGGTFRSIADDPFVVRVRTGTPYRLEVAGFGFRPKEIAVAALSRGETRNVDVMLEADDLRELRLDLRGSSAMPIRSVLVRLIPFTPPDRKEGVAAEDLSHRIGATRVHDEEFVVARVPCPAGRYVVMILPDPSASWLVSTLAEVDLPRRGTVRASLELISGGRIEVSLVDAGGTSVEACWCLRDSRGAEVISGQSHAPGASAGGGRGFAGPAGEQARWEADSLRRHFGNLLPGPYELEATGADHVTLRQPVTITAGATATARVVMKKPD